MKPELVIQDFGGLHNGSLEKTRARLMQGGSWKKQRVVCVIPAANAIPSKVYLSHLNLVYPPNNGVMRILALGMEVGVAYSTAIENILADPNLSQWEFLLTLEHDNAPPQDGVIRLIDRMENNSWLHAVSGLYYTKGYGGVCQRWGDVNDPVTNFRPQVPPLAGELGECCGIGMGFALWRLSMFKDKQLRRPWFKTIAGAEGIGTQDLFFWSDARKYGYRCAVDAGVCVGHYDLEGKFGEPDTMW